MRVFLTGATGFIGSAIIPELINAGHQVLGLTRSDAGAKSLIAAGARVHRGSLEDLESLRSGAAQSDGVIHCAFDHSAFGNDFSKFAEVCDKDKRSIEALGDALGGSDRPLVITSGTGMGNAVPGQLATEDHFDPDHPNPRRLSEVAGTGVSERGVNVSPRVSMARLSISQISGNFEKLFPPNCCDRKHSESPHPIGLRRCADFPGLQDFPGAPRLLRQ